ncbi:MAG: copper chaperone PCu(A)C [Chloroflexota bacterium]
MKTSIKQVVFVFFVIALMVSACQPKAEGPQISVEGAWGRNSPKVATAGAFYMVIKNSGTEADKLTSATSPACGMMELHESFMQDDGTMGMRPVEGGSIEVPAGGSVELKVGGLHVMCMEKMADFNVGDKYTVTLTFEKSGAMDVEVEIKETE